MKNYKCLTNDSSLASAIYVPYYAGLDVGKYLWGGFNISIRDESPKELMKWLSQQPQWRKMSGKDYFMVGGRIGYDFRRRSDNNEDWGTKLMFLPEASNMSILLIESSGYENEFPIPYPTNFHPKNDHEIIEWQRKMRNKKRDYLFSFAGAPRPNLTSSIRNELIKQCESSKSCKLVGCYFGQNKKHCGDPVHVMDIFQNSVFCLQPLGDSFTRRSIFDSILAGCIPVFFHPQSAYKQYLWHLPKKGSSYSVFIPEIDVKRKRVMINKRLFNVSKGEVLAMREEIIRIIPRILYRYPSSRLETLEDAFDVAVKGILGRIEAMRRKITNSYHAKVTAGPVDATESMAQEPDLEEWTYRAEACDLLHEPVRIALVGKYTCLSDSYFSVPEALIDASVSCQNVDWISVAKNKRLKKFRDLISVS
ncbi:unnamed protein product [Trifolium pratense]|uniref:Uncharacterized protein n=1 Tax=Trifolium pratense TaxID=57577 RepID=A0ACB0K745_TRIPR|nr:unnamed protein product [Trifolium pratense]